jgi:hypothetical protein
VYSRHSSSVDRPRPRCQRTLGEVLQVAGRVFPGADGQVQVADLVGVTGYGNPHRPSDLRLIMGCMSAAVIGCRLVGVLPEAPSISMADGAAEEKPGDGTAHA